MNIEELINRLEELPENTILTIYDNFGHKFSSDFDVFSWRGSYNLPAIEVMANTEYTVESALSNLKEADGKMVDGYKGGEFYIDKHDEVYLVADYSTCGDSVIITEIDNYGRCSTKSEQY